MRAELALLGLLSVFVLFVSVSGGLREQNEASYWLDHTQDVLLRAASLELHLHAAIGEARGFRLTSNADDAARYKAAAEQADLDLVLLRALTADNPRQQMALRRVKALVAARMAVLRANTGVAGGTVAASRDPSLPPAAIMAQVTSAIRQFQAEQTGLLAAHRADAAQARARTNLGLAAGGAMLSASMVLIFTLTAARSRERRNSETLGRLNAELERRVSERTGEYRATLEALRDSQALQRSYMDHAPFAMAILTPQPDGDYVYDYMNLACTRTYGRPREAFLGRRVSEIWPEPLAAGIRQQLAAVCFDGEPFPKAIEQQMDGGWRCLDGACSPLGDPAHGPQPVLVCAHDVTETVLLQRLVAAQVESLRQAAERERQLFEATPALLHSTGPDGTVMAVSDAWLAHFGYTREAVIGRPIAGFLTEESRDYLQNSILPRYGPTGAYRGEPLQAVCKSGETVDLLVSVTPECDASGNVRRRNAMVEDVTLRRRAERALAEERQRLSHIIDATGAATWEMEVSTGKVRLGAGWAGLTGRPVESSASIRAIYHPGDLRESAELMRRHIAGETGCYSIDGRIRHADGHWVWIHSHGRVMKRAADGTPLRVFGFATDVTARRREQEELRRSEQFLARTGACAGVGGWELDLATDAVIWSAETARIHGLPPDHRPTLQEAITFYTPEARPVIQAAVERCAADGTAWDLEVPLIKAGGDTIWVRAVGSAIMADGKVERLLGAFQDVTGQVSQRLALQRANELVSLATRYAGLGIWHWDLGTDLIFGDDTTHHLLGLTPQAEGRPREAWAARVHPEDRAVADSAFEDRQAESPAQYGLRTLRDDGSVHDIEVVGAVVRDPHGAPARIVGVCRDVTSAKAAARALAEQAALLRASEANSRLILDNAGDMISRVDADRRRLYVSAACSQILGLPPEAVLARKFETLVHPDDLPALTRAKDRVMAGEIGYIAHRFRVMHQERGALWVETAAHAVTDPVTSRPAGYISITRDISAQMAMEAEREERARELTRLNAELERLARHMAKARGIAEQANRAKTRFLAGMSHELRTPLNGILGYAQLLRMDGGLSSVQAERVQSMLAAGAHLLEMISCILDLSEIETEAVAVQQAPVDVVSLAEACLNIVRPAAEAKHLALSVAVEQGMPDRVNTDPARLRQIVLNLLGNAVKYTPSGSVTLRLSTLPPRAAQAPGGRLRLEVADTGPGIPPAHAHRLFEEFERLDAAGANTIEGAGLGLSLARRLASVLGGELGYQDNPGGGSIFWLELPLPADASGTPDIAGAPAVAVDFGAAPRAGAVAPQAEARAAARVLLVDDVAMNRDIAAAFISSAGYEVVCAGGGAEAVARAAAEDFLVILMDVRMPGMDGLEATRRIRALGGPRAQVPVVALTAQVFTEQIQACRAAGMDTHVAKPFTLETLLGAITRGVEAGHERGHAAPAAAPLLGCDLPALAADAFDRTAAVLSPGALSGYMNTLAERCQALKDDLAGAEDGSAAAALLADKAHALAGCAGMFGCDRLVCVARHFERTVKSDPAQANALAPGLLAALDATLPVLRARAQQLDTAAPRQVTL